jgi:hypothetical protein
MCDRCNPGSLGGPSATQVHGTIVAAVGVGFVLLALVGRVILAGVGPFPAQITQATLRPDGGIDVTLRITNDGTRTASASCRVDRGGVNAPDDIFFLTQPIAAGASITVSQQSRPPDPDQPAYQLDRLVVRCS